MYQFLNKNEWKCVFAFNLRQFLLPSLYKLEKFCAEDYLNNYINIHFIYLNKFFNNDYFIYFIFNSWWADETILFILFKFKKPYLK